MSLNIEDIYQRTKLVIGDEAVEKLMKSKVCICGIGGVGSYVMEALARVVIGNITVIDKDKVDVTVGNVDKPKAICAKERINEINSNIKVDCIEAFIDEENIKEYIDSSYDFVIDAIDTVNSKVSLIKHCYENNIKIISCMGMGNKLNPLDINVADIYKTSVCPLAKIMRKRLKEENVKKLKVVYSEEVPIKNNEGILGSVSFVPSTAGLIIASEVVKDIIKEK